MKTSSFYAANISRKIDRSIWPQQHLIFHLDWKIFAMLRRKSPNTATVNGYPIICDQILLLEIDLIFNIELQNVQYYAEVVL